MNHLLLLAYFFPPHGGGGVLRSVETVRLLENHGWRSTVIAGPPGGYWYKDQSLAGRVPDSARVVHTRALVGPGALLALGRLGSRRVPGRSEKTVGRLRRLADWLGVPDVYCGWIPSALSAAFEHARRADCILSTSPPESAHLAAWYLARKTGKRWVADFRDPWVRGIYRRYPTPFHKSCQKRLERLAIERADLVLATTEAAVSDFRSRYPHFPPEKFQHLPNGFDPLEFSEFQNNAPPGGPLRLIHTGGLTLDRDPTPLFEALASLNRQGKDRCSLELVGPCDGHFKERAEALGLAGTVTFSGFLPRSEVLGKIAASHLALLLESFAPGAELVVPGKFYDYLGARIPVLAVVPPGAAEEIVTRTGCGITVTEPESRKIAEAMRMLLDRFERKQSLIDGTRPEEVSRYERARLVEKLAGLLESPA
ncbi:MAG TPA: glycosyltransferase family 4 protein [archaeon]|nr:glycosyltransferase family 4 protein [archaeon]